jgi:GT2 family glycosyltransferase
MKDSISIIIISYNRPGDLLELLQSIRMQKDISSLKEILVLNNASTDSYAAVEEFIKKNADLNIHYVLSDKNLGVSGGRNKLMSMAGGEQLLVVDDDILFLEAGDLQKIASVFEKAFFKDQHTGVVTFRVIYHETKEQQKTAFPHKRFDKFKDKEIFLTSYFTGCAHLLQKRLLADTGLYPDNFFYGMEEYDLSYRIIKAGYSLGYDNMVTFAHKESPKGRQPNHQKLASQWVNKSKVAYRYLPRIYYVTTMISWGFEYLQKAKGHWGTFFRCWGKTLRIPFSEKRNYIGHKAMTYLRKVKARLWY